MKKNTIAMRMAAVIMTASMVLAGCGGQGIVTEADSVVESVPETASESSAPVITETPEVTETPAPVTSEPQEIMPEEIAPEVLPDEGLKTIGTQAEGDSVYRIRLTNSTHLNITGIFVKTQFMEDWPNNMLESGDVFGDMETRYFYYDASETLAEMADREETPMYNILLIFDNENEEILHNVALDDIDTATVYLNDAVAYLTYHSIKEDKEINTQEAEDDLHEQYTSNDDYSSDTEEQSDASSDTGEESSQTTDDDETNYSEEYDVSGEEYEDLEVYEEEYTEEEYVPIDG